MGQTLITSQLLTRDFLEILHSNLHIYKNLDQQYEAYFGQPVASGTKTGPSLQVRVPNMMTVRTGWPMQQQDLAETYRTLTIDSPIGVDLNFSDAELALDVEDFNKRYNEPSGKRISAELDKNIAAYMMKYSPHTSYGTLGTAPSTSSTFLGATQKLFENLSPTDELYTVIRPRTQAAIVGALAGQYNPQQNISAMFERGQMANALGLEWYMSQVLPALTVGTRTNTTNTVSSYSTANSTITISNVTSGGTFAAGDTFTVSTSYAVNPETKQTYSRLQEFVVTAATTAISTDVTLPVYPAPVVTGAYQNVSATPVAGTAVFVGSTASTTYPVDFAFNKKAFAVATVPLELPGGMDMASSAEYDGINVRYVRGFDIINARKISRMDLFYGITFLRPEWSCKILG